MRNGNHTFSRVLGIYRKIFSMQHHYWLRLLLRIRNRQSKQIILFFAWRRDKCISCARFIFQVHFDGINRGEYKTDLHIAFLNKINDHIFYIDHTHISLKYYVKRKSIMFTYVDNVSLYFIDMYYLLLLAF